MVLAPGAAFAHAFLDHADPAVGSTLHRTPAQVKLWFSEPIEPAFSSLRVFDARGSEIDKGDQTVSSNDKTLLAVSVPNLPPGTYRVVWRVVSADTHKTGGDFTFSIAP